MKDEGVVTMCFTGGLFIIGRLFTNKFLDPRVFSVIENGAKIQMTTLPGEPSFIYLGNDGFTYPIPDKDKSMLGLYHGVTHPPVPVPPEQDGNVIKLH